MSIKQMPGRVLISLLLSVTGLLSGCASHNENASLLAKKQAQNISQNLGNDSNLLIVFYVQIMPDDLVMQLHRF
ncbi:type II secretion system lipoprotein [Escherichia coli]|nr:type II secretion system lipoprotein [Escherichia coli]